MDIHEYQAKELLRQYSIATPDGRVARDAAEAIAITREFGGQSVVKAQIHAGGRGKGGGVKFAKTPEEAGELFGQIQGMTLVTKQTGPEGRKVHTVFIARPVDIAKELYLSFLLDRATGWVACLASTEGGMEIEEVAARSPDKIVKVNVHPGLGLAAFQARELASALGLKGEAPEAVHGLPAQHVQDARGEGLLHDRDQPAGGHRPGRPHGPGRQDHLR